MSLIEFYEARGLACGEALGEKRLIQIICKQLAKGGNAESIAEILEKDLTLVKRICDAAEASTPEYSCDGIYRKLHEN